MILIVFMVLWLINFTTKVKQHVDFYFHFRQRIFFVRETRHVCSVLYRRQSYIHTQILFCYFTITFIVCYKFEHGNIEAGMLKHHYIHVSSLIYYLLRLIVLIFSTLIPYFIWDELVGLENILLSHITR